MSNKGYEPIPDVEEGVATEQAVPPPKISPQEKYPQASEKEAELLGMLDDVIENAIPKFDPPLLAVESVSEGAAKDLPGLIAAIKIPAAVFVAAVLGALMFIALDNPIAIALYPYISTIMTFLGTLPALKARFSDTASLLLGQVDSTITTIKSKIDAVGKTAEGYVDQVEDTIQMVLKPIKPKLDQASKMESMLQKIDPDIDIPDTKDLEEELGDATGKIRGVMDAVTGALDFMKYIPKAAQSQPLFDLYIVYPVLAFFLVTQLLGVYHSQGSVADAVNNATSDDATGVDVTNTTTTLEAVRFLEAIVNGTNTTADEDDETFADQVADQWHLITAAFSAFVGAVVQIVVTFVASQKSLIFKQINKKIKAVSDDVSGLLTEKVEPVFKDVLLVSMSKVRSQILDLINKVEKIEGPMNKLKAGPMGGLSAPKIEAPKIEVPKAPKMPKNPFG
mmetsp:Transcript_7747/g.11442  ORF Transcript_7747/g.11442 Transcript_7747/m.11442 type:complete len:450 (+) Transcript_7747:124-1473(+)|eukprot:CAMPEP_0196805784 /NCGR_PEP_ID=MMETSP1362-20130617/5603_1 /TAXON_ID=163516 /ORGANISM="Leptocylindrus danicus, Strain CCMP1856" /LENGTH=449 /DNA_ID=CAMNT_0042178915 /DNA_START=80 /DNA_END=1429 /DNA_ORIENTATION=+